MWVKTRYERIDIRLPLRWNKVISEKVVDWITDDLFRVLSVTTFFFFEESDYGIITFIAVRFYD